MVVEVLSGIATNLRVGKTGNRSPTADFCSRLLEFISGDILEKIVVFDANLKNFQVGVSR